MRRVLFFIGLLFLSVSVFAESKDTYIDEFEAEDTSVYFLKVEDNSEYAYNVIVSKVFNEKYCELVIFSVDKKDGNNLYAEACKYSQSYTLYDHMKNIADKDYNLYDTSSEVEDGVSYKKMVYIP